MYKSIISLVVGFVLMVIGFITLDIRWFLVGNIFCTVSNVVSVLWWKKERDKNDISY